MKALIERLIPQINVHVHVIYVIHVHVHVVLMGTIQPNVYMYICTLIQNNMH